MIIITTIDPVTTKDVSTCVMTISVQQLSTTLELYGEISATAVTESSTTVAAGVAGQPSQPTHSVMETFDHAAKERLTSVREVIAWTLVAVSIQLYLLVHSLSTS